MFTLHRMLRHVGKVAHKDRGFAARSSVHVKARKDGTVRIEAVDDKRLISVDHEPLAPEDYPKIDGIADDGKATEALLDPKLLEKALKKAPNKAHLPTLRHALIALGKQHQDGQGKKVPLAHSVRIATTDLEAPQVTTLSGEHARFPDIDAIIPSSDVEPRATMYFDARLLGETLIALADMMKDSDAEGLDNYPVRIDLFATGKLHNGVQITADIDSTKATAVVMGIDASSAPISRAEGK